MTKIGYRKTKVMQILPCLEGGGAERVVFNLTTFLDRDRFEPVVCYLHSDPYGNYRDINRVNGIKTSKIDNQRTKRSLVYPSTMIEKIKHYKPSIVHIHSGCWYKASLASKLSGVKSIVYTEHGRMAPDHLPTICLDYIGSKFTNRIITVSEELKSYLNRVMRIKLSKISTIVNGIDIQQFRPRGKNKKLLQELGIDRSAFIVGNVARLAPVKDQETLIRAFNRARETSRDMKLLLVGEGSEIVTLEKLIHAMNLSDCVFFLGFRSNINEILSIIDVFVLSSISEGSSMTLLEAMASGKPVIATDVGGNSKLVIDDITGFLAPAKNVQAIAEKITVLYANRKLREVMGFMGRDIVVKNFSLQEMIRQYEELYHELII